MKGLLKFITCGSVDDGKSTLIGHILYDAKLLYADQERATAILRVYCSCPGVSATIKLRLSVVKYRYARGDNITVKSGNMPWYENEPLLEYLENIDTSERTAETGAYLGSIFYQDTAPGNVNLAVQLNRNRLALYSTPGFFVPDKNRFDMCPLAARQRL